MSDDFVALLSGQPDLRDVLLNINALVEVRQAAGATQLYDSGRVLVSVEAPVLVEVPGEVERLLGLRVEVPVWWVDVRAAADVPEASKLARELAAELVRRHGGTVWSGS